MTGAVVTTARSATAFAEFATTSERSASVVAATVTTATGVTTASSVASSVASSATAFAEVVADPVSLLVRLFLFGFSSVSTNNAIGSGSASIIERFLFRGVASVSAIGSGSASIIGRFLFRVFCFEMEIVVLNLSVCFLVLFVEAP